MEPNALDGGALAHRAEPCCEGVGVEWIATINIVGEQVPVDRQHDPAPVCRIDSMVPVLPERFDGVGVERDPACPAGVGMMAGGWYRRSDRSRTNEVTYIVSP